MDVDLRKYILGDYIILNNIDTWPISARRYLDEKKEIIHNYFNEDNRIELIKIQKVEGYENSYFETNVFEKDFENIKKFFLKLFFVNDRKFIVFHATRLTNYELENIINNGLCISSVNFINNKIKQLRYENIITLNEEKDIIMSHSLNFGSKTRNARINKLYFNIGDLDISFIDGDRMHDSSGLYDYFSLYGGEIIGDVIKKHETLNQKLKKVTKPYIIVCSVSNSIVYDSFCFNIDNIIKYYIFNERELKFSLYTESNNDIDVLETCYVDETSKIIVR